MKTLMLVIAHGSPGLPGEAESEDRVHETDDRAADLHVDGEEDRAGYKAP